MSEEDLPKRLRGEATRFWDRHDSFPKLLKEAADRIEALTVELAAEYDTRPEAAAATEAYAVAARDEAAIRADERAKVAETLRLIRRMAEMSAEIMRDPKRTGNWNGSERVARQFERIAVKAKEGTQP